MKFEEKIELIGTGYEHDLEGNFEGITYILPPIPDEKEIAGYNLSSEKQKHKRIIFPNDKEIKLYSEESKLEIIKRELLRRKNGYWFFNNGVPTYITGSHYFYLNYWFMGAETPDGYPQYRWAGTKWAYFNDFCDTDPYCMGGIMLCQKRFGKALDIKTPIPTINGWKSMEDIHVGDSVFGNDGLQTKVIFESEIQFNRDCYEIEFMDGCKIIADADHNWVASNAKDRIKVTKATREKSRLKEIPKQIITTYDMFCSLKGSMGNNWSIENCDPVNYNEKSLKIPPYILGIWLGDGNSRQPKLTSIDDEIIAEWRKYGTLVGLNCIVYDSDKISYALAGEKNNKENSNELTKLLREYNLFKNKHIPPDYLQSSIEQRIELLRGLMDTDGTISKTVNFFEYCSKLKNLRDDVYELIVSLGFKCRKFEKANKKYNKTYYYLNFGGHHINPFKLKRKADRFEDKRGKSGIRQHFRYVKNIVRVESRPVKCIQVDNESHTYLCGESFIPTHNTEWQISDMYNSATLLDNEKDFGMQSINSTEAKNNLFKRRLMRSHKRIPNYLKPFSNETNTSKEIMGELRFMGEKDSDGNYKEALNNTIDHRPTMVSAYQGKKPKKVFIDEPGTVEEMDLGEWWSTLREQLLVGNKVVGKAYLPTTLENMTNKGAIGFKAIWDDSNYSKRDANNHTSSGLYRYFKSFDEGREGFIDEYGNDKLEEARKYRENFLITATPTAQRKHKRQYPATEAEAFDLVQSKTRFSEEINDLINEQIIRLEKRIDAGETLYVPIKLIHINPDPPYTVPSTKDENLIMFEPVKEKIKYFAEVDGCRTGTENGNLDGSFWCSYISKETDLSGGSFQEVMKLYYRPEDAPTAFEKTMLMATYYNKYNGFQKIWGEANAGMEGAPRMLRNAARHEWISYRVNIATGATLGTRLPFQHITDFDRAALYTFAAQFIKLHIGDFKDIGLLRNFLKPMDVNVDDVDAWLTKFIHYSKIDVITEASVPAIRNYSKIVRNGSGIWVRQFASDLQRDKDGNVLDEKGEIINDVNFRKPKL